MVAVGSWESRHASFPRREFLSRFLLGLTDGLLI
ncbi:MAG: hypothetical protein ACJA0V_002804, partial [Planctomycetota bacterium]